MTSKKTEVLTADAAGVAQAASILRDGGLVAFPTETVYGLGADATNANAVAGIYAAKSRPNFNPLISHVPGIEAAEAVVALSEKARRLADAFWPGPMTLVLPRAPQSAVSDIAAAGLETLAVRVPGLPLARKLLAEVGRPVVAPSANPSGRVSATTAQHVLAGLEGRIDAVLDGGPCEVGVESTILAVGDEVTLLRPGGLPVEAIEACLGEEVQKPQTDPDRPVAPGQLASHYAPVATLRLNAVAPRNGELMVGFGDIDGDVTLSASGDLTEAATRLFETLRLLDERDILSAAVAPVPRHGLGLAINDRLERAAAPRP